MTSIMVGNGQGVNIEVEGEQIDGSYQTVKKDLNGSAIQCCRKTIKQRVVVFSPVHLNKSIVINHQLEKGSKQINSCLKQSLGML